MSERPYSRLYWEVMDDPKFDGIREDLRHFGAWSLMLIVADMAWPASAFLPPVPRASVAIISERGLIDILPGGRFRVHGLDKERNERSEKARASVAHRYNDRATAVERPKDERSTPELLAEPSTSRDKTSQANASSDDPAVVYRTLVGRCSPKVIAWLDDLSGRYGPLETGNAIAQAVKDGVEPARLIGVAESYLAEQKRRELQVRKPKRLDPVTEALKAAIAEKYPEPAA